MYSLWRVLRTFLVSFGAFLVFWAVPPLLGIGNYPWVALGLGVLTALTQDLEWHRKRKDRKRIPSLVRKHYTSLSRKLHEAQRNNEYGAIIQDDTATVLEEFIASMDLYVPKSEFANAEKLILEEVATVERERLSQDFDPINIPADGLDFESWVAEAFRKFGWDAASTVSSGDQGIDVIAQKAGKIVGIQTKLYSRPVGNKAVQEAFAGAEFHGLDVACVLSNAGYTASARDLAKRNGVVLMSHHDIPDADELFDVPQR